MLIIDFQMIYILLIARYKGENVFDVTSSEPFDITLTNVGNEPVTFTAHVVYR